MFRKLVSNLAFSPALVGQIGFYAKRLRKEEVTRRIGLIFTCLALVVQVFTVFAPPEAANAASAQDLVRGGVKTMDEYLAHYDSNTNNIKDMFNAIGITRAELKAAGSHKSTVNSRNVPYSFGMQSQFSAAQGNHRYDFPLARGGTGTVYYQPLALWDTGANIKRGSTYDVFVGSSAVAGSFTIMLHCGNLNLQKPPHAPLCPTGTTGVYPKCTVPLKVCPTGTTGVYPKCTVPLKATPVATCQNLSVNKFSDTYQLSGTSAAAGGAKVTSYNYVIKRDGNIVDTIKHATSALSDTASTTQSAYGDYTVMLTIGSSIGSDTGPNCTSTFYITPPAKCSFNPLIPNGADCQPCPGDTTIWIKDSKCAAQIIYKKSANNISQNNVDATTTTARAGDRITYTLSLENSGNAPDVATPTENLTDVAEYADVVDTGGGTYDAEAKTLSWPAITLAPKSIETRLFTVKVFDDIPSIGQGTSDKMSYDCKINNTFGNTVSINIDCPVQKQVIEQTVAELPHTGPRENIIYASAALSIITYFYLRSRQVKKEIRLIRRDFNAGTI
ncbi:MAG: hypothetical protein ABI397_00170 [Candidatus Saccharimonas sp.]